MVTVHHHHSFTHIIDILFPSHVCIFSCIFLDISLLLLYSLQFFHPISCYGHIKLSLLPIYRIAVNMGQQKCGMFSSFRWLSPDICHINILRNPNKVDGPWGRSAKPIYLFLNQKLARRRKHWHFRRGFLDKMSPTVTIIAIFSDFLRIFESKVTLKAS